MVSQLLHSMGLITMPMQMGHVMDSRSSAVISFRICPWSKQEQSFGEDPAKLLFSMEETIVSLSIITDDEGEEMGIWYRLPGVIIFGMSRGGYCTFLTDFSATLITGSETQPDIHRPPRQSSFLTRMKATTRSQITRYHIQPKRHSVTSDHFFRSSLKKRKMLYKLQDSMQDLKLNITTLLPTFRTSDVSRTSRVTLSSSDKLRKPTSREEKKPISNDSEVLELTKTVIKRASSTVLTKKIVSNYIAYEDLYGDPKGEDATKVQNIHYRDCLWKVAYCNNHILKHKDRPKVYVGRGNNSNLLKALVRKRWWWTLEKDEANADFVWTQLKVSFVYEHQAKNRNQVEYQEGEEVGNFVDMKVKGDPAAQLMNDRLYCIWNRYLRSHIRQEKKASDLFDCRKELTKGMKEAQVTKVSNHLQFSRMIGNKKALFYTMRRHYQLLNKDYKQFLPLTFHIVSGLEDQEYTAFLRTFSERRKASHSNMWIVKPGELSNRGNGITVCNTLEQIKGILRNKNTHHNGRSKTYIVQLYMSEPFLYKNRKFDIRHYLLITSVNGLMKGYWYQEGYIRTTSYEYNLGQLGGLVHLTNDAIQKYGKDYGKYEKGNKVSYQQFQVYLNSNFGEGKYQFESNLRKMKRIATEIVRASYLNLDPHKREHNFELFGLDFMIDSEFSPYLIEVNTNPCLQEGCPLLARLIPSMLDNVLRIAVDPLFPPPSGLSKKMGACENRFELVFDEVTDGQKVLELYKGQKGVGELLEDIGQDDQLYQDIQEDV